MKKILLLLFLLTGIAQAQIVNIPDANFKARLLSASPTVHVGSNVNPDSTASWGIYTSIDTNGDGEIQVSEAQNIIYLKVSTLSAPGSVISSLQGIEAFTNLQTLYCNDNHLTNLNLDGLSNLKFVNCSKNWLTSISMAGCTALTGLSVQNNALTSINLLPTPNMQTLTLTHNSLTSLDVSFLQNIWILEAGFNNMTSFSLSNKEFLTTLNLGYNQLTNVQLTNLPHLYKVNVQNNQLTGLDLSTVAYEPYINNIPQASLYEIECNNNLGLTNINLKNGYLNQDIDLMSSSLADNMQYICNDDGEAFNYFFANAGALVSTYCNYTPGGNYNTISGNLIFDSNNNNGCDPGDLPQSFIKVKINDGVNEGAAFVNESGDYSFYTQAGNFTLTPDVENLAFYNFSPVNALVSFPDNNNNTATQNFCITANGIHPDLEIVIAPITPARPGFDAVYKVVYKNKGNQVMTQPYGINFMYNQNVMNFVSASQTPASQGPGGITWDYASLMPFESRSITVTMHVNSPTATVPVNINDVLQLTATVLPMTGDETTADNLFQFNQTVVGSFDPNDKLCIEGVSISPVKIGEYLHYVINFENTGTAPAENIVVKDVIDTDKFDEKTLQVLDSSHPVTARISGNKVEFIFPNINLGYGGHGNILLKVKTRDNLVNGDAVENKADIFFDYNAPIETNVARTTFQSLGVDEHTLDNAITIYPNPTDNVVHIKSLSAIQAIQLYDVQGRVLLTRISGESDVLVDLTSRAAGIYFIKIITEKGTKVERIVKK